MKKSFAFLIIGIMLSIIMLVEKDAFAFGIGPYLESSSSSATYSDCPSYIDDSFDKKMTGFGMVLDSNLSDLKIFNYRMHLGYYSIDVSREVDPWGGSHKADGKSYSMDHAFGFGIVKTDGFRLWVGPELHLDYSNWDVPIVSSWGQVQKDSINFVGAGLGVVLGGNINLPRVGSVCPELGFRYQKNISDTYKEEFIIEEVIEDAWGEYEYYYTETFERDYSHTETVIFFRVSFMFGG